MDARLYDQFLELLAKMPKLVDRFMFSDIITEDRYGYHKVKTDIIKGLYFNPSFAEIFGYYYQQQTFPSKEDLIKVFQTKQILQPGSPGIGLRKVKGEVDIKVHHTSGKGEQYFLEDIAECFGPAMEALKASRASKEEGLISLPEKARKREKPGKEADDKIQERKQIVGHHIKQKSDFYDPQKFAALLDALDKADIPYPEYRGKKIFNHPWRDVGDNWELKERVIELLNRDRFKK